MTVAQQCNKRKSEPKIQFLGISWSIPVGLGVVLNVVDLVRSVSNAGETHRHRLRESSSLRSLEMNGLVRNSSRGNGNDGAHLNVERLHESRANVGLTKGLT